VPPGVPAGIAPFPDGGGTPQIPSGSVIGSNYWHYIYVYIYICILVFLIFLQLNSFSDIFIIPEVSGRVLPIKILQLIYSRNMVDFLSYSKISSNLVVVTL